MAEQKKPILRIHESIRQDVLGCREHVEKFLEGQTSPVALRAYRAPMGVYEQRAAGRHMVRIRIGAGLVLPYQVGRVAELSKTFGNGILHVTTRQDIQIHEVDAENIPDVLEGLLEVGLSARGGGGNTVRNVTACPRAGVCPKEQFDVAPYAIAVAEYLLQHKSSFNLPRKYKIVFSGCADDCAFASVADLGFFAHRRNGCKGFSVYAGGGLGSEPAVAVRIEDFIRDDEIFEVAEAIKRVFDKYGDRSNKHKARLRYVLARVGAEEFIRLYKNERTKLDKDGLRGEIPEIRDIASMFAIAGPSSGEDAGCPTSQHNILPEKTVGLFTVIVRLNHGDIPADDLLKVRQIAEEFGQGLLRTTQLQDIMITGVPQENVDAVNRALETLSISAAGKTIAKVVTCTGAATCKLGLCLSRGLADAISQKLGASPETIIRISGCPNSCGHHYIADIGFQGKAKRLQGRLMPFYDVFVGAATVEGDAHLGQKVGTVPAKRIPELIAKALGGGGNAKEQIRNLVGDYEDVSSGPLPDDYYYDFGAAEPFSLAGRGSGECGAGVMDVIKVDLNEANESLEKAKERAGDMERSESLYKAVTAAARALLVTFGLEPKKDREIFAAFTEHLIEAGWVAGEAKQLLNAAIDWRMGDRSSIADLSVQAERLAKRVKELFLSLDANLQFKIAKVTRGNTVEKSEAEDHVIDLRGVACPLNFVKAKLELEKIDVGRVLEVLLDDGEPARNVPESFANQGQEVLGAKSIGDHFSVRVRRKK